MTILYFPKLNLLNKKRPNQMAIIQSFYQTKVLFIADKVISYLKFMQINKKLEITYLKKIEEHQLRNF